mgnify:FL=1
MYTTYLRDLFHIRRTQIIILILAIVSMQETIAQGVGYKRKHLEFYDDKPIHYGISFGMPFTRYNVQFNQSFLSDPNLINIETPINSAFRMGFTINKRINDRFDIRTTPAVSLYDKQLKYSFKDGSSEIEKRESTWIEIPLLLKYKSERRGNSRMYLMGGFTLGIETNVKRSQGSANTGRLETKGSDFSIDYGIGYEQFFEFFKFAPELRFSHGLTNIISPTRSTYSGGVNKLTTHTVTLYLNFE